MKDLIIICAGGVGKETALLVEVINKRKPVWNLLGFVDDNPDIQNMNVNGFKVLGGIDYLKNCKNVHVVCAIANYVNKKNIVEKVKKYNLKFANIIHPDVHLSGTDTVGEDVIIYPEVVITTNIKIGNHVIISPKCGIGHESVLEDYSVLLWNVNVSGNVRIGEGSMLGTGATIIQNINIGRGCTIGAGTVVIRDAEAGGTYVGVPARRVHAAI